MSDETAPSDRDALLVAMAEALAATFGPRAIDVARRQRDLADPGIAATWDAIIGRLTAAPAARDGE